MEDRFRRAQTFEEFLRGAQESGHPWREFYDRARVPEAFLLRGRGLKASWHLLALAEGWCGDGANSLPPLARLAEAAPGLELRVLPRDENPDLMDGPRTDGNRSIPVVMVLDEDFREVGWWGPRPAPLQEIFLREIRQLPQPERYPRLRAWYAKDGGRTVLEEIFALIPESA